MTETSKFDPSLTNLPRSTTKSPQSPASAAPRPLPARPATSSTTRRTAAGATFRPGKLHPQRSKSTQKPQTPRERRRLRSHCSQALRICRSISPAQVSTGNLFRRHISFPQRRVARMIMRTPRLCQAMEPRRRRSRNTSTICCRALTSALLRFRLTHRLRRTRRNGGLSSLRRSLRG
jgi:hypothetical protein